MIRYPTSDIVLGLKDQRSWPGLGLTAIQQGFELYECLLVSVCWSSAGNELSVRLFHNLSLTFRFLYYKYLLRFINSGVSYGYGWAVQTIALFFPGRTDFKRGRYLFSPVRRAGF